MVLLQLLGSRAVTQGALAVFATCACGLVMAQSTSTIFASGKLLATGGVSSIDGAAGGGLTPWALIGGYGTRDEIGGSAALTHVRSQDFSMNVVSVAIGVHDRVEFSYAQQRFDTRAAGAALGLGSGFKFTQDIFGAKLRVLGDAVYEQDALLPQIAIGIEHKRNNQAAVLKLIGARDDQGTDFYISASKLFLAQSLLANATLRFTRANQNGLLGFGGDQVSGYRPQLEGSLVYLPRRDLALGVEYRMKPSNLGFAREQDWADVFVAWFPSKHASLTVAYAWLGDIATFRNQRGAYASLQVGF